MSHNRRGQFYTTPCPIFDQVSSILLHVPHWARSVLFYAMTTLDQVCSMLLPKNHTRPGLFYLTQCPKPHQTRSLDQVCSILLHVVKTTLDQVCSILRYDHTRSRFYTTPCPTLDQVSSILLQVLNHTRPGLFYTSPCPTTLDQVSSILLMS